MKAASASTEYSHSGHSPIPLSTACSPSRSSTQVHLYGLNLFLRVSMSMCRLSTSQYGQRHPDILRARSRFQSRVFPCLATYCVTCSMKRLLYLALQPSHLSSASDAPLSIEPAMSSHPSVKIEILLSLHLAVRDGGASGPKGAHLVLPPPLQDEVSLAFCVHGDGISALFRHFLNEMVIACTNVVEQLDFKILILFSPNCQAFTGSIFYRHF